MQSLASTGSRAVVVGASSYDDIGLADIPSVRYTVHEIVATLESNCGMARESINLLVDPKSPREIGAAVAHLSSEASDALLFYFVGHGLISPRGDLYLADGSTDRRPAHLPFTAVAYSAIREAFHDSIARSMVVILDCCFSGRAIETLGASSHEDGAADLADISGGCVLAAAARDQLALAPEGEPYTAFSGELIKYLRKGEPDGDRYLTLRSAYRHLALTMQAKGLPRPRRRVSEDVDALVLAPNAARIGHERRSEEIRGRRTSERLISPLQQSTETNIGSTLGAQDRRDSRTRDVSTRSRGGKARVHELAKELGVSSNQVMSRLQDMGEYVRSPSSTVEAPVARKLRNDFEAARKSTTTRFDQDQIRVEAIADECGIKVSEVMDRLHRMGVQVYGPKSTVAAETAERLSADLERSRLRGKLEMDSDHPVERP